MNDDLKRKKIYSISDLASEFVVSPRTIRFYEEKNLISPVRTTGNQRSYSSKDRARLKLIMRGKRLGFSLDDIAEMIGMSDSHMKEVEQIKKSLEFGERKLAQIRWQKEELALLEEEILSLKQRLIQSLNQ